MIPESLQLILEGNQDLSITIEHCDEWRVFLYDLSIDLEEQVEMVRHPDLSTALSKMADAAVKYA